MSMLLTLSMLAAQAAPRDPTWAVIGDWQIARSAGPVCTADRNVAGVHWTVVANANGDPVFTVADPAWTGRTDIDKLVVGITRPVEIRVDREGLTLDGQAARRFTVPSADLETLRFAERWLHIGRAKGESVAGIRWYDVGGVLSALAHCTQGLQAERAATPLLQVSGPLLPWEMYSETSDYPAASLRAEEQGLVRVRLDIAEDGYPDGCSVVLSSGYARLDEATCRGLRWRARFAPSLTPDRRPMRASVIATIRWALPRR